MAAELSIGLFIAIRRRRAGALYALIASGFLVLGSRTDAASLRIESSPDVLRACEPMMIRISVAIDESETQQLGERDERGIPVEFARRAFDAVLRDESGEVVATTRLFLEWQSPENDHEHVFACNGLAVFVNAFSGATSSDVETLIEPGHFSMAIQDRRNSVESNAVPIEVVPFENPRERAAADVILRTFPESVYFMVRHDGPENTVSTFQALATKHGDTKIGAVANLVLAVRRAAQVANERASGTSPEVWASLGNDIEDALRQIPDDHPFRPRALFELCMARIRSSSDEQARAAQAELERLEPRGSWAARGRGVIAEHAQNR